MLIKRVLTAMVGLPIVVAAVWLDPRIFALFTVAVVGLALAEFGALAGAARGLRSSGIIIGVGMIAATWFGIGQEYQVVAALFFTLAAVMLLSEPPRGLDDWSRSLLGLLLIALPATFLVLLREQPEGARFVLLALFGVFAADTGAYIIGSTIGRRRLAPKISPKKSWEGLAGGVILSTATVGFLSLAFEMPYSALFGFLVGIPVAFLGTFGDLSVSLVKRSVEAKDSGGLLPGHGGFLDRLDSLTFVGVFFYIVSVWINS